MYFAIPEDHGVKKKKVKRDLARELTKLWNMNVTVIPIVIGTYNGPQRLGKGAGRDGHWRTNRNQH